MNSMIESLKNDYSADGCLQSLVENIDDNGWIDEEDYNAMIDIIDSHLVSQNSQSNHVQYSDFREMSIPHLEDNNMTITLTDKLLALRFYLLTYLAADEFESYIQIPDTSRDYSFGG